MEKNLKNIWSPYMEFRSVNISEVDLIERLFQQVYKQEKGIDYWKWSFQNPHGYINTGLFENNRLIGYYAAHFTKNSAYLIPPMINPNYDLEKIFKQLSKDLYDRISTNRSFIYTFSYDPYRTMLFNEGFIDAYQIKEYGVSITKTPEPINWFESGLYDLYGIWRYRNHPLIKYIFHENGVFRLYDESPPLTGNIQIVDYEETDDLYELIEVAKQIGYWNQKNYITFWCEADLPYNSKIYPIWKSYKSFDEDINIEDIIGLDKLRIGMNYDF